MNKIFFLTLIVAIIGTGCKKSFLDVNTNPNALPTATPAFVISNAINQTASGMVGVNELGMFWSGHWTQSNGYILATTLFKYEFTNNDFNYWDGTYDNLGDYKYVLDNAANYDQQYLIGPAKIMMAYQFQKLVDLYGNIPFSEALKGVEILAPKFDEQKSVYAGLITWLDGAIADCKTNSNFASQYAPSDIVFKGNLTKWIKFANSLKLRILVKQSRVAGFEGTMTTEINKILAEGTGLIEGEDVGSNPGYVAQPGQTNPYYSAYGYNEVGARTGNNNFPRATEFIVEKLKTNADTFRLKRICYAPGNEGATPGVSAKPEIAANYIGVPFGANAGFLPGATCAIGPVFIIKGQLSRPVVLLTAAEVQFCLAEAKQRLSGVNLPNTAQKYYEEGVRQNFRSLGADLSKATQLLTSGIADNDWAASTDKLKAIAYQKWFALGYYNGLEAWSEYRKNNYPNTPQSKNYLGPERPLRLYYPGTEAGSNGANVDAQGAINPLGTRIFWDID
ncbi:MAG: SusD/RagB family nutrient-binding outer membrane lipoprotein [Chitinophagaceae bacterium]